MKRGIQLSSFFPPAVPDAAATRKKETANKASAPRCCSASRAVADVAAAGAAADVAAAGAAAAAAVAAAGLEGLHLLERKILPSGKLFEKKRETPFNVFPLL